MFALLCLFVLGLSFATINCCCCPTCLPVDPDDIPDEITLTLSGFTGGAGDCSDWNRAWVLTRDTDPYQATCRWFGEFPATSMLGDTFDVLVIVEIACRLGGTWGVNITINLGGSFGASIAGIVSSIAVPLAVNFGYGDPDTAFSLTACSGGELTGGTVDVTSA